MNTGPNMVPFLSPVRIGIGYNFGFFVIIKYTLKTQLFYHNVNLHLYNKTILMLKS